MMKLKYILGILLLSGMLSCDKDLTTVEKIKEEYQIETRSTSSAIPLVDDLAALSNQLKSDGEIPGNVNTKIQYKLTKAKNKLEQNRASKAIKKLNNLISYLNKQINKGKISPEIGALLIADVEEIIAEISAIDNDGDGYNADEDCDDGNAALNPGNTTGLEVYNAITNDNIISQTLSSASINADDNETNLLTPGAIVLYKTNEGRFGKLMIENYGYSLTVRYTTYDYDGSVFSTSPDFVINGTFTVDMDLGVSDPSGAADLFWEQLTEIERELESLDNVAIALFECN